jgi:hypothetical protein
MKTLKHVLAVLAVATSVSASPTDSEMKDARDSAAAFSTAVTKFWKVKDWTPLVDELEHAAKQYVGKSKIQLARLDIDFPSTDEKTKVAKTKVALMCVKLDDAAAQAIRFTEAYRKCLAIGLSVEPKDDIEHTVACSDQVETERQKFITAAQAWSAAALDFVAWAKK